MFRLQDNVPDIYVNESRDFQLLCRIYDCLNSGVRFDTKSMLNCLNPLQMPENMLELYASRVGFFPKHKLSEEVLRHICSAFPYIIKNKGTIIGVKQSVATILKAETHPNAVLEPEVLWLEGDSIFQILVPIAIYNKIALEELLRYVLPAGACYVLYEGQKQELDSHKLDIKLGVKNEQRKITELSSVDDDKLSNENFDTNFVYHEYRKKETTDE